ncbi:MAG: AbrB family transcriptional regulator [Herminiimonas sp.]|nr:AbrB family transcriptional regulator [Herminiimonas sp.]MDB5852191.1 AbrB family transcriptional regulator [Herminiimonas sp.]
MPLMPLLSRDDLRSFLLTLAIGLLAANACVWLNTPLPWMIGPLLATAVARMCNVDLFCPVQVRQAGQWAIGTALGLYFTPAVVHVLSRHVGSIALGVVFAIALGLACGWLLHRLSGVDKTTAFFAMAVGGASEMAAQGERHGASVDRIAAAHSLRIMMVVVIIPFAFRFFGAHGLDPFVPGAKDVSPLGLIALTGLTAGGALLLGRLEWPNVWVIGPLIVSIALTAMGINLSALPEWSVHFGQLFIGVSLGTRFTPQFLHTAPRYMGSVILCGLAALALAAGFGLLLSWASGINPATAILATSPGGIAEMSLTAKTLQLGVPIVTAFHVTRMAVLVMAIGPLFKSMRYFQLRANA